MSGTHAGGLKTVKTIKATRGEDWYVRIGKMGGTKSRGGGFSGNPELARKAGAKGGAISKRGPAPFFIIDEQIDNNIIEPLQKESFFKGWFKRSK